MFLIATSCINDLYIQLITASRFTVFLYTDQALISCNSWTRPGLLQYNLSILQYVMESFHFLCLLQFTNVVLGSWFFSFMNVQTQLYIEDWIGLRTLDEAGRVKFINVTGGHLDICDDDMKEYIVPYLIDVETLENPVLTESSREKPSSSDGTSFIRKLGGQQDLQLNVLQLNAIHR